jgi:arginine exporter protein ArgO
MIFRALKLYRMAKKGVNDPTGLAVEEAQEAVLGVLIIPSVIVGVVLILLGILGFSDLILKSSIVAQIFFWIVLVGGILWGTVAVTIGVVVSKLLRKAERVVKSHIASSQIPDKGT